MAIEDLIEYNRLLDDLFSLSGWDTGKENTDEVNRISDAMDAPWDRMTEEERKQARQYSEKKWVEFETGRAGAEP